MTEPNDALSLHHFGTLHLRSGEWEASRIVVRDAATGRPVHNHVWLWDGEGQEISMRPPDGVEVTADNLPEMASYATSREFPDEQGNKWTAIAAGDASRILLVNPEGRHHAAASRAGQPLAFMTLGELREVVANAVRMG